MFYFDCSYELKGSGAGLVLVTPQHDQLQYAIQIQFPAINKVVEYKDLLGSQTY